MKSQFARDNWPSTREVVEQIAFMAFTSYAACYLFAHGSNAAAILCAISCLILALTLTISIAARVYISVSTTREMRRW